MLFASLEAAALTSAVVYGVRGARAYRRYQDATTPEEAVEFRKQTVEADRVRNISIVAAVAVWALNIADAAWAARRARRRVSRVTDR